MALQRDLYRKQFANIADVKVHDIYGASWDKGELPDLTRTDKAVGLTANVGIDAQVVQNDFDNTPLFGSIREVEDAYGNKFMRIPKLYIKKTDGVSSRLGKSVLLNAPDSTSLGAFGTLLIAENCLISTLVNTKPI